VAGGRGRGATPADTAVDRTKIAGRHSETATDIGIAGEHVVVDIQIAVDYGAPMWQVAARVRDRIAQHIATQTGLTTTEVNVTVVDVQLPPDHSGTGPGAERG
jgi:uncharacterized alkaline shock family protein YloU